MTRRTRTRVPAGVEVRPRGADDAIGRELLHLGATALNRAGAGIGAEYRR